MSNWYYILTGLFAAWFLFAIVAKAKVKKGQAIWTWAAGGVGGLYVAWVAGSHLAYNTWAYRLITKSVGAFDTTRLLACVFVIAVALLGIAAMIPDNIVGDVVGSISLAVALMLVPTLIHAGFVPAPAGVVLLEKQTFLEERLVDPVKVFGPWTR